MEPALRQNANNKAVNCVLVSNNFVIYAKMVLLLSTYYHKNVYLRWKITLVQLIIAPIVQVLILV